MGQKCTSKTKKEERTHRLKFSFFFRQRKKSCQVIPLATNVHGSSFICFAQQSFRTPMLIGQIQTHLLEIHIVSHKWDTCHTGSETEWEWKGAMGSTHNSDDILPLHTDWTDWLTDPGSEYILDDYIWILSSHPAEIQTENESNAKRREGIEKSRQAHILPSEIIHSCMHTPLYSRNEWWELILEAVLQWYTNLLHNVNKRSWLLTVERRWQRHTPLSTSLFMFLRITTHICPEKKIKLCHLRKIKKIPSKVLVNIYREAMVCELVCARPRSGRQNWN